MATRASIVVLYKVEENGNTEMMHIYHHWDGHPENLGSNLKEFLSHWQLWQFQEHWDGLINHILKGDVKYGDGTADTAFEWSFCIHGDIDFLYVIDCTNGTLRCFRREKNYGIPFGCVPLKYIMAYNTELYIPTWDELEHGIVSYPIKTKQ